MASERIATSDIFDEIRLKHEYCELLRSRLGEAPAEAQSTFLGWVRAGPDIDDYRRRHEAHTGSVPNPEDEAAYVECWKRDWLSIVAEHLSGDEAEKYGELVQKHGEADNPDLLFQMESWSGPETPITAEAMREMSVGAVIEYLASWEADDDTGWGFGPSIEGLGRTFEGVVSERAAEFAAAAHRIRPLDPTYVRSFLCGLEAAVKADASVPWDQPMRLIASVLEHPFEAEDDTLDRERDPGWSWTRGQAASLIREGVADQDNRVPFELRRAVWGVLEPLTRDPATLPNTERIPQAHRHLRGTGSPDSRLASPHGPQPAPKGGSGPHQRVRSAPRPS